MINYGMETNKKARTRKPFRSVRVFDPHAPHGVDPRLILEIWPNGTIYLREHGRRVRRETHAAKIYVRCIVSEIAQLPRKRRRARR